MGFGKRCFIQEHWERPLSTLGPSLFLKLLTEGDLATDDGSLLQCLTTLIEEVDCSYLGASCRGAPLGRVEWEGEKTRPDPHPKGPRKSSVIASTTSGRSFTKRAGLSPHRIGVAPESSPSTFTLENRPIRYASIHHATISPRLKDFIFAKRHLWFIFYSFRLTLQDILG